LSSIIALLVYIPIIAKSNLPWQKTEKKKKRKRDNNRKMRKWKGREAYQIIFEHINSTSAV
jgi:hypothetical protein